MKTVREMVADQLREMGADGLCCVGCGCSLDDLMPCGGEGIDGCEAATSTLMTAEEIEEEYGMHMHDANCRWYTPFPMGAKDSCDD